MILIFHFLCFLAQCIVSNIYKKISKNEFKPNDSNQGVSFINQLSTSIINRNSILRQPVYQDGTLKFFPPVYIQRYETVALILEELASEGKVHKVVDFGCAELGFFKYLKHIKEINEILEVDIDEEKLRQYSFKAAPLITDYLMSNCTRSLDVFVLAGSITEYDDCLAGTDAVVVIEVIEHLSVEVLSKVSYNIFHEIKPKIAVFTTPNAEFNSLFPNFTGLRHNDHIFEWTREEFSSWAQEIVCQHPEYSVKFYGIGAGPEGTENLGCCTQMALFQSLQNAESFENARGKVNNICNYKLINHYNYPVHHDTRTREEKILHEIQYQMPHILTLPDFHNYEENESLVPLGVLKKFVTNLCSDDEELRNILKENGMNIRLKNGSWCLVQTEYVCDSSDNSIEENDFCNEVNKDLNFDQDVFTESWDTDEDHL